MHEYFYNNVIPMIVKVAQERGYKYPSAIISQAACESAWGESSLAAKYFNYFGMKCGSSWKGKSVNMKTKEEYKVGTLTTISDNFRAYDNLLAGINGYFDFIQKDRYKNLKDAVSPEDYITKLKQDGWATSSSYINTLTTILNKNNFKKYDNSSSIINVPIQNNADKEEVKKLVKNIQEILNKNGATLVVDGIFGTKTMDAYNKFRR